MKKPFKETTFGKICQKVIFPIGRGIIKAFPGGAIAVEIAQNLTAPKTETVIQGEATATPAPHKWLSIAFQLISLAAVVYAFITKSITIDELLHYLNFTPIPTP